jgi:hypothetical protein
MAVSGTATLRQLSELELMGHLLRRAGFGGSRDEIDAALAKGYEATVEDLLHPERTPDLEEDLLFPSFPDFHESRKVDVVATAAATATAKPIRLSATTTSGVRFIAISCPSNSNRPCDAPLARAVRDQQGEPAGYQTH